MSGTEPVHGGDEPVFERNLRALLVRCHAPARPEPAFRERARAACLAALPDAVRGIPAAGPIRAAREDRAVRTMRWRPALAAAALLLLAVSATLWWRAAAGDEAARDAILARGEAAGRSGPRAGWQAFAPEDDGDPAARDVAHAELAGGALELLTPAGLGLDVDVAALGAGAGAFLDPESSVLLDAGKGLSAVLRRGGLSLSGAAAGAPWTLETPHGALSLMAGTLSARLQESQDGDSVWLLVDGRAALQAPAGPQALPSGRALRLRDGAFTWAAAEDGTRGADGALGATERLHVPAGTRPIEVLPPHDAGAGAADGSAVAAAPVPRLLAGRVRRGGEPVTEFRLVLVPQEVPPRDIRLQAVTAPDGRFTWSGIAPGDYTLFVLAAGVPVWKQQGLSVTDTEVLPPIDAELAVEGASIAGFVVDALTGEPIEGAVVLSESDAPSRMLPVDATPLPGTVTTLASSDELGAFRLERLAHGEQLLRATAPGHAPAWSDALQLATGEDADGLLFRLAPEARLAGRVIGTDGRPWAAAVVIASPQPDAVRPCVSFALTLTDAEGRFLLGNQPEGAGIVLLLGDDEARAAGFPPRVQPTSLAAGAVSTADFLLAPESGAEASAPAPGASCHWHGLLLDASGATVAQRMVSIVRADAPEAEASEQWRGAMTTDQGEFSFAELQPGAWRVFIGHNDGSSTSWVTTVELPASAEWQQDVRLADGLLAGRLVRAEDGQPVARGLAILMRRTADGAWDFQGRQFTDAGGRFRFEYLPAGRYAVTAHDLDGQAAQQTGPELALAAGGGIEEQLFALAPGAGLRVRVRDGHGRPVSGALVRFTDERGEEHQFAASTRTDSAGLHEARGMRPGLWFVAASPPAGTALAPREQAVEVRLGPPQELELVLPDAP